MSLANADALKLYYDTMEKQCTSPYLLVHCFESAKASVLGFKTSQNIQAMYYFTPENNFYDSYSKSPFLATKDRFYDENGKVTALEAYGRQSLTDSKKKTYSYDEFIQNYGKLIKRKYYVYNQFRNKEDLIHDVYLCESKDVFAVSNETTKHPVYGLTIYKITNETIKTAALIETFGERQLVFDLDVRFADDYNRLMMFHIGNLYELPKFTSSKVTFYIDDEGYLIKATSEDRLEAKTGFISADVVLESEITYLRSRNNHFTYKGVTQAVQIPSFDTPFNGHDLFRK